MKSQTATGILASMVIGGIMGTLISYPINTIAERRSSAAWDELSNELESLAAEMEWFDRATKAQNFSSVVDIGDSALPLISRLDAKAKALRAKNPASEEAKKAAQQPRAGTLNSVEESRPRLLVSHLTTNPIANKTVTAPRGLVLQTGPGRGVSSLPAKLLTSSHSHLKASGRQGGCGLGLAVCERWRANAFSPSRG